MFCVKKPIKNVIKNKQFLDRDISDYYIKFPGVNFMDMEYKIDSEKIPENIYFPHRDTSHRFILKICSKS